MTDPQVSPSQPAKPAGLLPGMAVICIWMLALCGLGLVGVITHSLPPSVMIPLPVLCHRRQWSAQIAPLGLGPHSGRCVSVDVLRRIYALSLSPGADDRDDRG